MLTAIAMHSYRPLLTAEALQADSKEQTESNDVTTDDSGLQSAVKFVGKLGAATGIPNHLISGSKEQPQHGAADQAAQVRPIINILNL